MLDHYYWRLLHHIPNAVQDRDKNKTLVHISQSYSEKVKIMTITVIIDILLDGRLDDIYGT